jgi:hypothetical protein
MKVTAYCRKCKRKHRRGTDIYRKHYAHLVDFREKTNPVASNLYESFHGVAPVRKRKVYYEAPPKELICIGILSEIRYKPVRGKHVGTEFFHRSGDTGEKTLKSNLVLATDSEGKNLYLLKKTKGSLPRFTNRGIIG